MRINVNGHEVEVPDGSTDDQIKAIVQKNAQHFASPPAAPQQSTWDNLKEGAGNLVYGLAKGAADPVYGATQLALHGVNSAYQGIKGHDLSSTVTGKNSNWLQQATDDYDNFLHRGEAQYQSETPGSYAAGTGRFLGNMLPAIASMGAATAPAAAGTVAANMSRTAAQKVAQGALSVAKGAGAGTAWAGAAPVYNTYDSNGKDDYWDQKEHQAKVGAMVGAALPAAKTAWDTAGNMINPIVRPKAAAADTIFRGAAADAVDGANSTAAGPLGTGTSALTTPNPTSPFMGITDPGQLITRIEQRPRWVPGVQPTTAQVVQTPMTSMGEKALMNQKPYLEAFNGRGNDNNAALIDYVKRFAGTPDDLKQALAARSSATDPLYDAAWAKTHPVDDELSDIMNTGVGKAAMAKAREIVSNLPKDQRPAGFVDGAPAATTPTGLLDAAGNPITNTTAATTPTIDGQTLKYLQLGMKGLIPEGQMGGIQGLDAGAKQDVLKRLNQWLVDNAPEYKAADEAYRTASIPVNQMRVGQAALRSLGLGGDMADGGLATDIDNLATRQGLNTGGQTALTLSKYQAAINKAKNAEPGADYLSPDAVSALDAVAAELQRQTAGASAVPKTGSDTAYNLSAPDWLTSKFYGNGVNGTGGGMGMLGTVGGILGSAASHLAGPEVGTVLGPVETTIAAGTGGAGVGGALGNYLAKTGKGNVDEELQRAFLDPDYFAALLKQGMARSAAEQSATPTNAVGALTEAAQRVNAGDQ